MILSLCLAVSPSNALRYMNASHYVALVALYNFRSFTLRQTVGLLVSSIVYYICYQGLVDSARMAVHGGAYFDVLVVCLSAQVVGLFTSYGWYIYILVSHFGLLACHIHVSVMPLLV